MKLKMTYLCGLWCALVCALGMMSCGEDRWPAYYEYTGDNLWIDEVMRRYYLWEEEMPKAKELTSKYFATNAAFLSEVKFEDDSFTALDSLDVKPSYGMTYTLAKLTDEDAYAGMVTYVEPSSPAGLAGIERGTWIMAVDGQTITSENSSTILADGKDHLLTMGRYYTATDEDGNETGYIASYAYAPLGVEAVFEQADVPYSAVLAVGDRKVGYLLCNRFTEESGELLSLSNEFSGEGVTDVVLDLRYNQDSTAEGLQLIASLLAPASSLGSPLATLKYNSRQHPELPTTLTLSAPAGGTNLGLSTLYVLTSSATRGMAEHLINCLKPYMDVVTIGSKTKGEYYAMQLFDNEEFGLQLRLVTAVVSSVEGEADFSGGISPDETVGDTSDPAKVLPFGDAGEALLSVALEKILGE